ncbi:MAG: hypothetical protein PVG60_04230, partial [Desulfarculaceae bacterium]
MKQHRLRLAADLLAEEVEPPPNCQGGDLQPHLAIVPAGIPWGPSSPKKPQDSHAFRRRHFPGVSLAQWNDWHWQVRNRVTSKAGLSRFLLLSEEEQAAFDRAAGKLPLSITPYYLSLLDPVNAFHPLRKAVVPSWQEAVQGPGESTDPLNEDGDMAAPNLVHRYPDRVLFLATGFCSTYCRYCT